jgi:hypothetical protein
MTKESDRTCMTDDFKHHIIPVFDFIKWTATCTSRTCSNLIILWAMMALPLIQHLNAPTKKVFWVYATWEQPLNPTPREANHYPRIAHGSSLNATLVFDLLMTGSRVVYFSSFFYHNFLTWVWLFVNDDNKKRMNRLYFNGSQNGNGCSTAAGRATGVSRRCPGVAGVGDGLDWRGWRTTWFPSNPSSSITLAPDDSPIGFFWCGCGSLTGRWSSCCSGRCVAEAWLVASRRYVAWGAAWQRPGLAI